MNDSITAEIERLEARRCKAQVEDDYATLEALIADDLVYTHSSAKVDSKASFLESLRSGAVKYRRIDRSDVRTQVHGDAVFVTGAAHVTVAVGGEDRQLQLRYSNVWLRGARGWQFALWHATPIPKAR